MIQKPETSFRIRVTGIREKVKGSEVYKGDVGIEGAVIDWVDIEGYEVWIPVIILYDGKGKVVFGDKVWWKRVS